MRTHSFVSTLAALVALVAAGCQVAPPEHSARALHGLVRAEEPELAHDVAAALDRIAPLVVAEVPGSSCDPVEVWVQDEPALYAFAGSAYSDADGFWAEGVGRIHLRASRDRLERTLAHELVHRTLGPEWDALPGTLEEGLCDVVASRVCPESSAKLRAGRLSSAAFATGGLFLDLELALAPHEATGRATAPEVCWSARLRIDADPTIRLEPLAVFSVRAGLSTSPVSSDEKKGYYGLAYLVIERIVAAEGLAGLHARCVRARERGLDEVPVDELLAAAGLTRDDESWRAAALASLGRNELAELVRSHPQMLVRTLAQYVGPYRFDPGFESLLERLRARLSVPGSPSAVCELDSLRALRPRLVHASDLAAAEAR